MEAGEGELEFNNDFSFSFDEESPVLKSTKTDKNNSDASEAPENITKSKMLDQKLEKIRREKLAKFNTLEKVDALKNDPNSEQEESDADEVAEDDSSKTKFFDQEIIADENDDQSVTFADMNLSRPLLKGLAALKFENPTPIQRASIPVAMMGKDICGGAVTGSGKTAAFLIPIIERLLHKPKHSGPASRVLILLPTRELAVQCFDVAKKLTTFTTNVSVCLAAGGLPMKAQELELRRLPDIIIATPGRLIDHIRNSLAVTLVAIEILVLDEADRMLEDGFADELNEIIKHCPKQRQTILFSATMTDNVDELVRLSLKCPARIFVDSNTKLATKLTQEFVRIRDDREADRMPVLFSLCRRTCTERCIIFFPTKELAHRFRLILGVAGLRVAELHGGLTQAERLDALESFKNGTVDFLTATDVAARGLDISGVLFVLNYSMPLNYKLYLHRVGRTARAGLSGRSITLVGEGADRKLLKMVIKNATEIVKHRQIQPSVIDQNRKMLEEIEPDVNVLIKEEKEAKLLSKTEKELHRAENLLHHKKEIQSRPKKTWFQSNNQKAASKKRDIDSAFGDDRRHKTNRKIKN